MPIPPTDLTPSVLRSLRLLIRANHILSQHSLVDAFGHISIRHPSHPSTQYILASYSPGAPALISSRADFIAYTISDSEPVDKDQPQGYSERFIHGEILKMFPRATCVVHSHSEAVVPFTAAGVDVRPVFHMAGFLGADALPVFKAEEKYNEMGGEFDEDMLIKSSVLGEALAGCMSEEQPVVLQHKHGFTCFGGSVEQAVYRAVYTQLNCRLLKQALELAGGNVSKVAYLTEEEARDCRVMNEKTQDKAFRLWLKEVQRNPMYVNEEGEPNDLVVGGMAI